jgi:hypothetical protein
MKARSRLPEAKVTQSVLEVRYPKAHRYWDDCGKLISAVETAFPGLTCQGLEADGFRFAGNSSGLVAAKFFWDRANVQTAGRGEAVLAEAAGKFVALVQSGLSIVTLTRLGHRTWFIFPTDSLTQATKWLDGFTLWQFAPERVTELGHPMSNGSVLRTRLEPGGRRMRMEVNSGTISEKNYAEMSGVIVDIDIVSEIPDAVTFDVGPFVDNNRRFIRETVQGIFRNR